MESLYRLILPTNDSHLILWPSRLHGTVSLAAKNLDIPLLPLELILRAHPQH